MKLKELKNLIRKTILETNMFAIDVSNLTDDELTQKVTPYNSYEELLNACREGYIPTLYTSGKKTSYTEFNQELSKRLNDDGFEVFNG